MYFKMGLPLLFCTTVLPQRIRHALQHGRYPMVALEQGSLETLLQLMAAAEVSSRKNLILQVIAVSAFWYEGRHLTLVCGVSTVQD